MSKTLYEKAMPYLKLEYPVVIKRIAFENGGGYFAEIKELPGCCSKGDNLDDAYQNVESAKYSWILNAIKNGQSINLPKED